MFLKKKEKPKKWTPIAIWSRLVSNYKHLMLPVDDGSSFIHLEAKTPWQSNTGPCPPSLGAPPPPEEYIQNSDIHGGATTRETRRLGFVLPFGFVCSRQLR